MAARKIKAKAQMIAAYKLEVHEGDLEWDIDGFRVKGLPEKTMSMKDICWAAYNSVPPGMEPGLEAVSYYDPPNMTYPFGAYICVMNIDVDTGVYKIRRFYALDDCGTRINPMIIEGQVHGGLTEAFAIAMGQEIRYDPEGNVVTGSFMDFFMPTAVETPHWETDFTVTPSPHHPIGAKGVGESPNVGGVPAFSNAVNDAFSFLGSTHIQMPHDYWRNWKAAKELGVFAANVTEIVIPSAAKQNPAYSQKAGVWIAPSQRSRNDGRRERHENPRTDRASPRRLRLHRRRRARDRDLADATAETSAAAGRRGRRRQDRSGKGAGSGACHRTDPAAML